MPVMSFRLHYDSAAHSRIHIWRQMATPSSAIAVPGSSTSSIRIVMQAFVVLFLISFLDVLLRHRGVDFGQTAPQITPVDGVVLSLNPERFTHTKQVLAQMGIPVVQKVPPSFQSQEVEQSLNSFFGSRQFHSETNLKVWSNRMAFVDSIEAFVAEHYNTTTRWRFFFEDDLAMNPNITSEQHAKVLLAKGLEIAEEDGFVYLGMCGPTCEDSQVLDQHVETARCAGTCAHAFGFQPRAAAKFLQQMSEIQLDPQIRLYFDRYLLEYGRQVEKVWVLGSNLKSPVVGDHIGLLYQDRLLFPTSIG